MHEKILFLMAFFRHPHIISSVIPTSRYSLQLIAKKIDGSRRRVIVEYGPGTGGLAKVLLTGDKLTRDSKLILIEKTGVFADYLIRSLNDPRVHVFHDSAEFVDRILEKCGEKKADYVLCSVPLTIFPSALRETILSKTRAVLAADGVFIVYLIRGRVKKYLRKHFPRVTASRVLRNIPPLIVCEARAPTPDRDHHSAS